MRATNKAKASFGLAVGAAIMLSWPAPLPAEKVPPDINTVPKIYVLINGTRDPVICQAAAGKLRWSASFRISRGRQWSSHVYDRFDQLRLHCEAPVRPTDYVLKRGKRYILQRVPGGAVDIVEVVTTIGRTR